MWQTFVAIGTVGGLLAGLFGVGGGIVIVPALIYLAGFSQHQATGTSLAVLLPPIGLGAAIEYYRHGNVNVPAAIILAITMFLGTWLGAGIANKISGPHFRLVFGIFVWGSGDLFDLWRLPTTRLAVIPRPAANARVARRGIVEKMNLWKRDESRDGQPVLGWGYSTSYDH